MTHDTQELVAEAITEWFGPRCEARDTDELPELRGKSEGRCPACLAWEQYDALTAQAEEIRALREALQSIETLSAHQNNGILYTDDAMGWNMALDDAVDITRAALAGKGEA